MPLYTNKLKKISWNGAIKSPGCSSWVLLPAPHIVTGSQLPASQILGALELQVVVNYMGAES